MSDTRSMADKVALITGAASGLGRATAETFAEAGARLCVVDVNEAALNETAERIGGSDRLLVHATDLSVETACTAAVQAAVERFGRLDALCNVAGLIYLANTPEMPSEQYRRTIDVNLNAAFFLSQAALPHIVESEGAIVNVVSSAAFIGEAYAAAYCASKWGLLGLTKALAMEYVKTPIRINAVAPGGMVTNIAANFRLPEGADVELIKRYSGLRGTVDVADVAAMILRLAGPEGKAFHGTCVTMDAGITAG